MRGSYAELKRVARRQCGQLRHSRSTRTRCSRQPTHRPTLGPWPRPHSPMETCPRHPGCLVWLTSSLLIHPLAFHSITACSWCPQQSWGHTELRLHWEPTLKFQEAKVMILAATLELAFVKLPRRTSQAVLSPCQKCWEAKQGTCRHNRAMSGIQVCSVGCLMQVGPCRPSRDCPDRPLGPPRPQHLQPLP